MYYILIILIFGINLLNAQLSQLEVDNLMAKIPLQKTHSTESIASYIREKFSSDSNRLRAIFYFTANHISYDIDNMYAVNFNETSQNKIDKALKTKKGVCINYAEVFNDIARKLGFESYVVEGITKQNGANDALSHAWNATKLYGEWYLFDATWGSGSVYKGRFLKKLDNQYYKAKPKNIIKSHYPFDYLWQFVNNPIKANDFLNSKPNSNHLNIDYEKLMSELPRLSEVEKLNNAVARVEENGLSNGIIFDRYVHLKQTATIIPFNEAVYEYNEAVKLYNDFINYRNAQFKPMKADSLILLMIENPKKITRSAKQKLESIRFADEDLGVNIGGLKKTILGLEANILEQSLFVEEYIATKPNKRKGLFYNRRITWFGIPLSK